MGHAGAEPEDKFWERLARGLRRRQLERLTNGRLDVVLDDLPLHELRDVRRVTQKALARSLAVQQARVSKLERRTDMLVSSLGVYVAALGGTLDLIARFPDGVFRISGIRDTCAPPREEPAPAPSTSPTRRRTSAAPAPVRSRR